MFLRGSNNDRYIKNTCISFYDLDNFIVTCIETAIATSVIKSMQNYEMLTQLPTCKHNNRWAITRHLCKVNFE